MFSEQHMQKAREIVGRLNQTVLNESDRAYLKRYGERCIATALHSAQMEERERCAKIAESAACKREGITPRDIAIRFGWLRARAAISTAIRNTKVD